MRRLIVLMALSLIGTADAEVTQHESSPQVSRTPIQALLRKAVWLTNNLVQKNQAKSHGDSRGSQPGLLLASARPEAGMRLPGPRVGSGRSEATSSDAARPESSLTEAEAQPPAAHLAAVRENQKAAAQDPTAGTASEKSIPDAPNQSQDSLGGIALTLGAMVALLRFFRHRRPAD